jgi:hypothetical protein
MLAAAKQPIHQCYPDQNEIFILNFFVNFFIIFVRNFFHRLNIFNFICLFDDYYVIVMYKRALRENCQELKKCFYCCSKSD